MQVKPFNYMRKSISEKYQYFSPNWENAINLFGGGWEDEFNKLILNFFGNDTSLWESAIEGYVEFCSDAIKSQIYFEQHGEYKSKSYSEVNENYYQNAEFMQNYYLPGMLLAHYIWPHHQKLLLFFKEIILKNESILSFAEVGTGTGLYSLEILRNKRDAIGTGYDISGSSLDFTKRLISAFNLGERYNTNLVDIVKTSVGEYDFIVCQEVLEHLENPPEFLEALNKMTKKSGYAYITAAVNAGHVDHIYLYRNEKEVETQLKNSGFNILDVRTEFAFIGKPIEKTPSVSAFYCQKA